MSLRMTLDQMMTSMAYAMSSSMAHSTTAHFPARRRRVPLDAADEHVETLRILGKRVPPFAPRQDSPGTGVASGSFQVATSANRASAGRDFAPVFFMIDAR